jgi:hypothetical protein
MKSLSPFSFYDVIGYLLTGFTAVFLYDLLGNWSMYMAIKELSLQSELNYAFVIVTSYLVGHIISFISSFTVERMGLIVYGNPSQYLRNFIPPKWYNHFMNTEDKHPFTVKLRRAFLLCILLPLTAFDIIIGGLLGMRYYYTKPFDNTLRKLINIKIKKIYEHGLLEENDHRGTLYAFTRNEDWFNPLYHYLIDKSERHFQRTQNYIALYGFTRNLALIGVVFFWTYFCKDFGPYLDLKKLCFLLLIGFVTYVFYMAYLKFYKKFHEEVYLGIFAIELKADKIMNQSED